MEVVRAYDASCPEAMLDARELRKAMLNLVLNAMESLGPGGKLTVSTGFSAETRTVTVIIEDTGCGMTEETLSRMFDLFFTTKPQGTGLGMALARSVVDLHGGDLAIHSTGAGAHGSPSGSRSTVAPAEGARRSAGMRHTVLVVDDEASIADGLRLTLEAEGYSVRIAGSVRTALGAVAQAEAHVAIVDLMLPDGDGLSLTRDLKTRDPALEVIVITAYGSVRKAMEATKGAGAFHIVEKPFEPDEVLGLVKNALEHRKLVVENTELRRRLVEQTADSEILGSAPGIQRVMETIASVADTDANVLDHRRERHRQGADRQRAARAQRAAGRSVDQDQLRRAAEGPHRVRAVRPHQGLVHRRHHREDRPAGGGPQGLAPARRDHARCRWTCRPSCSACWRSAWSAAWAAPSPSRWTSGCSPRRTAAPSRR